MELCVLILTNAQSAYMSSTSSVLLVVLWQQLLLLGMTVCCGVCLPVCTHWNVATALYGCLGKPDRYNCITGCSLTERLPVRPGSHYRSSPCVGVGLESCLELLE